jgi:competence protein ComEC
MQRERRTVVRAAHAAAAFAAGIGAAGAAGGAAWMWAAGALGIALIAGARRSRVSWIVAILCAGVAMGRRADHAPADPPPGTAADDRAADVFDGEIAGPIERGAAGDLVTIVPDGGVGRVGAWVPAGTLLPGDRVRARGRLMRPRGFRDPGAIDRAQVARDRGVAFELEGARVERTGGGWSLWAAPVATQRWGSAFIARRGGDAEANAVVRGAVLGDRSAIGPDTDQAWRAAGVYHVLSVSGLHLAVVALLAFAGLRRVLVLFMASRAAQAKAAAMAAVLGAAYTAVTGAQVATVRALIVVLVMLLGVIVGRRARLADALGAAAILILAARPSALGDPSFQLSFAAAMTLAVLRVPIEATGWKRPLAWIARGVIASATVTAVTAPITAAHFHQVAIGGVVGNLIVTPLVELVAIPLALAGVVIGTVWSGLGGLLVDGAVAACAAGCAIARAIAAVVPASPAPPLPPIAIVAWLGAIAALVAAARGAIRPARAATVALASIAVMAIAVTIARAPRRDLRVTFVDVGQGDAAVIEAPGGEVWLVDAGGAPDQGDPATTGPGDALVRFLAARGIDHVDVAIVSHPHPDHYLGLFALAGRVPVGELWSADESARDDVPREAEGFAAAAAALAAHGARLVHPPLGVARTAGGAALVVLAPEADLGDGRGPRAIATADPVESVNDTSLVVAVEYAGRRIVFTGDLEAEGEAELVAHASALAADVVKVPHHGSPTSSSPALVAATHPHVAVISCGVANRFGFPSPAVVARWRDAGATVLETDRRGAITVEVGRDGALDVGAYDQ